MSKIYLIDVCKYIIRLQRDVYTELRRTGEINQETGPLLADLRDYARYRVLDALEGESEEVK